MLPDTDPPEGGNEDEGFLSLLEQARSKVAARPGILVVHGLGSGEDAEAALVAWCTELREAGADVEYGGVLPGRQPQQRKRAS